MGAGGAIQVVLPPQWLLSGVALHHACTILSNRIIGRETEAEREERRARIAETCDIQPHAAVPRAKVGAKLSRGGARSVRPADLRSFGPAVASEMRKYRVEIQ